MGVIGNFINSILNPKKAQQDKQREAQKRAWQEVYTPYKQASARRADPVAAAITDNAVAMNKNYQASKNKGSSSGGGGTNGGSDGDGGASDGSADGSTGSESTFDQEAYDKALASIKNMKDSNISYKYKTDYNDLWNKTALQEHNEAWGLKEEVFLYTFHDKEQHRYLNSFSIDIDKTDIMGTCQVSFPYDQRLMEYWIPGKTTFAIVGGTFDREILFVGRVSEVNQVGEQIDMVGQNVGWKFKAYMTKKFETTLQKMTVKNAVKLIFKELGFEKGRYHIDLNGIPNVDKYVITENCTVEKDGEQIQNVPELKEVVENLKKYDIDKYIAKKAETRETQKVAEAHDKQVKMSSLNRVIDSTNTYYPSSLRQNYGISTEYKEERLLYTPIIEKLQGDQELEDYLVKGYSGGSDYTYEDVLTNIASSIDAHFFIIDTTVCFMSFNAMMADSSLVQKVITPTIDFWQLQEESFELDINQYGYYNTVKVKYKDGIVTATHDDLVRVYSEIPITYDEPKLDYEAAMLKAQAYLSAHIRDFGMQLKATILYTGKIVPSTFIKLKNPLTMSESLYFIHGVSVQWSADNQTLIGDLDLRFGPENPDDPEVPEVGASYSSSSDSGTTASSSVSANISQAAQEITKGCQTADAKAFAIYDWVDKYVKYEFYYGHHHSSTEMLTRKMGNCWDTAYLIYDLCSAVGVKCEVWNGNFLFLDGACGHLWNKIWYQGRMQFADTGYGTTGSIKRNPIGSYHGGKILSGSCVAKNY